MPGGFFSSFQTTVTDQNQSSRQSTTSYSQSITDSVTGGYKWGNAETGSASVSAGQMWEQYATTSFGASSATGFDDEIWFVDARHNLYVYPVIGKLACPAPGPGSTGVTRAQG